MEKTTIVISNMRDLRNDLVVVYNELRNGTLPIKEAKEISNIAGKIIGTAKIELVYALHQDKIKKIEFLENGSKPTLEGFIKNNTQEISNDKSK